MYKFLTAILLIGAFAAEVPWARPSISKRKGGDGSGGGVVFSCDRNSNLGFSGRPRYFLADSYSFFSKQSEDYFLGIQQIPIARAIDSLTKGIAEFDATLATNITKSLERLHFNPVGSLNLLGDDDIGELPAGCIKIQLAIQDLASGRVDYDLKKYWKLSSLEKALFRIHEAYVSIYGSNSSEVRAHVSRFAWSDIFKALVVNFEKKSASSFCIFGFCILPPTYADWSPAIDERVGAILCENGAYISDSYLEVCRQMVPVLSRRGDLKSSDVLAGKTNFFSLFDQGFNYSRALDWVELRHLMKRKGYIELEDFDAERPDFLSADHQSVSFFELIQDLAKHFSSPSTP